MPVLALDTATRATTVALQANAEKPALEARDDPPPGERPGHTACLLPLIAEVLERSGTSWRQLRRIAVGVGPGSFTGLRVGIASARALAQALELPLVGVSTLRSVAASVQRADPQVPGTAARRADAVVAVLDARRGEVFAAAWSTAGGGLAPMFGVRALSPAALVGLLVRTENLVPARTLAIGDGALAFRDVLEPSGVVIPDDNSECHRVTAVSHCRLAWSLPALDPDDVHPCYVRSPDAQPLRRAVAPTR